MKPLFDFGLSQEDPLSEQKVLNIQPKDKILSVASGGEVPLALISLNKKIKVVAVDISEAQIKLCKLKIEAAIHLDFPLNAEFLGYTSMPWKERKKIYFERLRSYLSDDDKIFWDKNIKCISKGIVNTGRFERYIKKMRIIARVLIGRKNFYTLVSCEKTEDQEEVFNRYIATRKSLELLFKLAFHPRIYKRRGLQERALQHASITAGEMFFKRFKTFCTGNLASKNYFLHYFLEGRCITSEAIPEYLQPEHRCNLLENLKRFKLCKSSFLDLIQDYEPHYFNKIHLSNLGDWMPETDFKNHLTLLKNRCDKNTVICYRHLQKDYSQMIKENGFTIDKNFSSFVGGRDRFPFYTIYSLKINPEKNFTGFE